MRAAARLAATLSVLLGACGGEAAAPARPLRDLDVVLIVLDTLRTDHVGCYGETRPTTPAIDGLAASGVRCLDATAQSSWTAPSMVSLFTGRHVASDFVKMPEGPTMAERLRAAGMRTVAFQDNILLAPGAGFERGFDTYVMEGGPVAIRGALDIQDGRPLFAYFHFVDPHDPYKPEPEFDLFAPQPPDAELRERFAAVVAADPQVAPGDRVRRTEEAVQHVARQRALYAGDVRQVDRRVAFVLQQLAETGRLQRSLVILAADHGECLWDHAEAPSALAPEHRGDPLRVYKQTHNTLLTQELIHVPLLLAGAGLPAGVSVPGPVENIDILPTVLDVLGQARPPEIQGRSLLPEITAAAARMPAPGRALVVSNTALFTSVRSLDGRKLVVPWKPDGPDAPVAYRLAEDPRERRPLDPQLPEFAELWKAVAAARAGALTSSRGEDQVDAETQRRLEALGYAGR
jgi:arylsulfatase A-like enzyme